MTLDPIIVEAAISQDLVVMFDARRGTASREAGVRAAIAFWVAHPHDQGELRHRDDIASDFEAHLPPEGSLL